MHTFWEIVTSNALIVTALALGVALLGRLWRNPAGLHLLWMLVLLKLFTPPLVTIGVPLPVDVAAPVPEPPAENDEAPPPLIEGPADQPAAVSVSTPPVEVSEKATIARSTEAAIDARVAAVQKRRLSWPAILAWTWGIGIAVFASGHACRMLRFQRLLRGAQAPPAAVYSTAERVAKRLGLKRIPEIVMLPIRLSPLVWCVGGRPRVILPAELFERLGPGAREAILAHELAHVRRKDHLVRLLELVATTLFWWHPVVWWASRELQELEEQCCDTAVLEAAPQGAKAYATALVDTVDFLSERSVAAPLGATGAKSTVSLARRISMLEQSRANRLTVRSALVVTALAVVPMAIAFAREGQEQAAKPTPGTVEPRPAKEPKRAVSPADQTPATLGTDRRSVTLAQGASVPVSTGRVADQQGKPLADLKVWGSRDARREARSKENEPGSGNFLMVPITTNLQRARGKEYEDADVVVLINAAGVINETDTVLNAAAVDLRGLGEVLMSYASKKTDAGNKPNALFRVYHVRSSPPPKDGLRPASKIFRSVLEELIHGKGFPDAQVTTTFRRPDWKYANDWESLVADLTTPPSEEAIQAESGVGDEQVRLYPVRTPLSRYLHGDDVDCVIHIIPPIEEAKADVIQTMRRSLPQLKLKKKDCVRFVYHGSLPKVNYFFTKYCGEHVYKDQLGFRAFCRTLWR